MAKKKQKSEKLQDSLVLFKYILSLFGCKDLAALSEDLKDPALEGVDEEGTSHIFNALKISMFSKHGLDERKLREYDENIVRFTREINEKRLEKIQWKYYQYLSLLFTEIYLDRYFSDKQKLLDELNDFLINDFNNQDDTWHGIDKFEEDDLTKLAFWCATGSGKTLMMHVNIKQYLHYAKKYNAKKLNRIILLTPNEGLSFQHLIELRRSNMQGELFSKQSLGGMFSGDIIDVIDINKLSDTNGDKTVAVDCFEGNNLVLVDEGHKGTGGDVWKVYRKKLTSEGFSFEYSATFGQAVAAQSGKSREELLKEYGKATLFDYSYRYFYNDGYGKDYRIMNMSSWDDEELFKMYLTAYLLTLYEQTIAYESNPLINTKFLVARPLGIFVGGTVNAVRTVKKKSVSDVVEILLFLKDFINKPDEFIIYIKRLLDSEDGIKNLRGYSLFANSFSLTKKGLKPENQEDFAKETYAKVIKTLFHCDNLDANLYLHKQTSGDKEIGICMGSVNPQYFGVINVGDSDSLLKLCEENGINCETKEFGTSSLFNDINNEDSTVTILIGSKKFSEGWSSWRVSVMGLMNVGRSEGSEIIQLFGRGVRLKGFQYSLKRSSKLDTSFNPGPIPKGLKDIETLNIFGVRADYMEAFRKYLEDEGLPANEDSYTQISIPTVNLLGDSKLKIVRLKEGYDFKKSEIVNIEDVVANVRVKLDWTPKVEAIYSKGTHTYEAAEESLHKLLKCHYSLIDWNEVFFALQQMKNERGWYNMELSIDMFKRLMDNSSWYELKINEEDLAFHDYGRDVSRWQEITISLLRLYVDRAYKMIKGKCESKYLETIYIGANDPNFFEEYKIEVRNDKNEWIEKLKELAEQINSGHLEGDFSIYSNWIKAVKFDKHLYYPLLCLRDRDANNKKLFVDENTNEPLIKISPVALNVGETTFIEHIRIFYNAHKDSLFKGKDVYLLRNESRKGIGFFESNNFYPDFILWVNEGEKQHVTFIDPKGIRNLKGLQDDKIQLFSKLKTEIEPSLNDENMILDSFIISNTQYKDVSFWGPMPKFIDNHVLFQTDDSYVEILFNMIVEK